MKKKKYKQGQALHVVWKDITSNNGWHDPQSKHYLLEIESVGLYLKKDKETLSITQSHSLEDHHIAETLTIPWSCIKKVKLLR